MTIKEVEKETGLARSNIRFYEKEKLIKPSRNEKNGYRDYSKKDIETIKKIAFLRTLGISVEDIRLVQSQKAPLAEIIQTQTSSLRLRIEDLNRAKAICKKIQKDGSVSYDSLQPEKYVADLPPYWSEHKTIFKLDSVGFLYLWGSLITWAVIALLCLALAILTYPDLPDEIPIQWSNGSAVSYADKKFMFACPLVCLLVRVFVKPVIYTKMCTVFPRGALIAEYLSNYLCFLVFSAELFSVLFVYGVIKNIALVLFADTAVLIGILVFGILAPAKCQLIKSR